MSSSGQIFKSMFLLLAVSTIAGPVASAGGKLVIGAVEDRRPVTLRVLFSWADDEWISLCRRDGESASHRAWRRLGIEYLGAVKWRLLGRQGDLGVISVVKTETPVQVETGSKPPAPTSGGVPGAVRSFDAGLFGIRPGVAIPWQPGLRKEYCGWLGPWMPNACHLPLLAISPPPPSLQGSWRPATVDAMAAGRLRSEFRVVYPNIPHCTGANRENVTQVDYTAEDIGILDAHTNARGDWIAALKLTENLFTCDLVTEEWSTVWFYWNADTDPRRLVFDRILKNDSTRLDVFLIAGNDLTVNGLADLLFYFSGYDEDGYVLWTPNVGKQAACSWTYH